MTCLMASFQAAYVADIVCALLLLVSAFIGAKKGFVKCFFGLISTLVALILAFALASTVAGWLSSVFGAEGFALLGGQVCRRGRVLAMHGPARLHGARVRAADLRGGAGLVVAALSAGGESVVEGAEYVRRGYADLAGLFRDLGGVIQSETQR